MNMFLFRAAFAAAIFLALWMVGCVVEGWQVMRGADDVLDVYDTDEPVPLLPVDDGDRCTHPDCEKARELHRQRIRRQLSLARVHAFTATRGRAHWSEQDDAEFAEFARSNGGA